MFSFVGWTFALIIAVMGALGLPGLLGLSVVGSIGIPPLPSEIVLTLSGVLIVEDAAYFDWGTVLLVAVAGTLLGAVAAYELGRWGGRALLLRWGRYFYFDEADISRAERFFARHGELAVGAARMVPLLRAYISYPAGVAEMDRRKFAAFTFLGTVPYTVLLVYLGTLLGENFDVVQSYFTALDIAVVVGMAAVLVWYIGRARLRRPAPAS
jgi:membrane protein DedA with SNARE-associated domain